VVHGDVRWNNALLADRGSGEQVVLIDWEFAQMGDPAWDLAGGASEALFGEALIESPADGRYRTADACDLFDLIKGVGGYLRGLAEGYRGVPAGGAADEVLRRSAPFVAARLVHNAFQHAIWDPNAGMAQALVIASLASSIFRNPDVLTNVMTKQPVVEARPESPT
jgi:thiamine kinase-like enzyme